MAETQWGSTPPKMHSPVVGAIISLDPTISLNFQWVPGQAEAVNALSPGKPGQNMTIIIQTSGTDAFVLTFTNYFKSTGTLSTGVTDARFFVFEFVSNGHFWFEKSRTGAMA